MYRFFVKNSKKKLNFWKSELYFFGWNSTLINFRWILVIEFFLKTTRPSCKLRPLPVEFWLLAAVAFPVKLELVLIDWNFNGVAVEFPAVEVEFNIFSFGKTHFLGRSHSWPLASSSIRCLVFSASSNVLRPQNPQVASHFDFMVLKSDLLVHKCLVRRQNELLSLHLVIDFSPWKLINLYTIQMFEHFSGPVKWRLPNHIGLFRRSSRQLPTHPVQWGVGRWESQQLVCVKRPTSRGTVCRPPCLFLALGSSRHLMSMRGQLPSHNCRITEQPTSVLVGNPDFCGAADTWRGCVRKQILRKVERRDRRSIGSRRHLTGLRTIACDFRYQLTTFVFSIETFTPTCWRIRVCTLITTWRNEVACWNCEW